MDILNEKQYQQPEAPKGKNVILTLLIISVILAIAIIIEMVYLEANKVIPATLIINGQQIEFSAEFIIKDGNGDEYISLKDLAKIVGYTYDNSEYQKYGVDTAKCYIKNGKLISGFELDSNKIYKYEEGTDLDYQYYNLTHNIIVYNDKLYIAVQDLQKALNISYSLEPNNVIRIQTVEYLAKLYEKELKTRGYILSADQNNQKAIAYGWIIVSRNNTWSVLNKNFQEILGEKYSKIYFDEYNLNYIVSNLNGQYGIISNTGSIINSLKYDDLKIVNYENMLYEVRNMNKHGIIKSNGEIVVDIIYDDIGYEAEPYNKILYTLIIPELDGKSGETIVVKQDKYYGLVSLNTGEVFLPCDHVEKLYSISDLGQIYYKIEAEKQVVNLLDYLNYRGIVKIN